ncbi:hypothetical protein GS928_25405 [Rhodococcus hoagii]|nr:hypothetical protein [Prescottella equi]
MPEQTFIEVTDLRPFLPGQTDEQIQGGSTTRSRSRSPSRRASRDRHSRTEPR